MVTTLSDSVVVTDSAPLITADYTEILNSLHELKFSTTADSIESASILEEYYAVVKVDNQYKEFVINDIRESDESELIKEVTASLSSVELADSLVENKITGTSASVLLRNILNGTRWTVGTVESGIYSRQFTEDVQFMTVLEAVFALQTAFNCDVNFSYVVEGSRVVSRRVNLYARIGASDGKRFEIDKDVTSLERLVGTTQLATAIYPIRREEVDGKEVITDISSLVWTTADGKPVNKPAGQKIISDPVALQNWGRIGADGKLYDRVKLYEFNEDVSLEQMAQMSWINLGKYNSPNITYTAKVVDLYSLLGADYAHEKIVLGDDAVVIDRHFANPVVTESRVIEYHRDLLDPTENEVVLGFSVRDYASSRSNTSKAIQDAVDIATQARLNASSAIASANGKNTNFFGTVRPVNPRTGDLWFRPNPDNPEQQQMLYWDGVQWVVELDTAEFVFPEAELEELRQAVAEAKKAGEDAIVAGEEAKQAAEEVSDKVGQLETEVAQAVTDADSALTKANEATDKAEEARNQAFNSEQLANSAKQDAANAQAKADTAKNSADKAVLDAQKALDDLSNLEIGGRNLLLNSSRAENITGSTFPTNGWGGTVGTIIISDEVPDNMEGKSERYTITTAGTGGIYHDHDTFQLNEGYYYTYSFWAKGDTGTTALNANLGALNRISDNSYINSGTTYTINQEWTRYSYTFKCSKASEGVYRVRSIFYSLGTVFISHRKLEVGNKVTAWTPNPEDVQIQITNINNELSSKVGQTSFNNLQGIVSSQQTQITQNKSDITSKADKSEVNTLKGTVDSQGTKITQNAEAIEQRATKTEVNTLTGRVSQTETTVSTQAGQLTALSTKTDGNTAQIGQLQSSYDGLSSTVSKVETDLNGMSIGVRNYFSLSTSVVGYINGVGTVNPPDAEQRTTDYIEIDGNTDLILQSWAYVGQNNSRSWHAVAYFDKDKKIIGRNSFGDEYVSKDTFQHFVSKYKTPLNTKYIRASTAWMLDGNGKTSLTVGNKAVDWTPAPEDLTTTQEFSSFQQTVNGFQTTVNSDITGMKSQQTQMSGQITSLVTDTSNQQSQITQLSSDILLSVKKDGLLGEINLQAGKALIRQGDNVLMVTPETTFIQDATIKTAAIEDAAITTAKIGNLAVNTAQIANLAVGTAQLKDAVITNAKIGDLAVDTAKIADLAVNAAKIQNASITSAKILNLDVDKIVGNTTNFVQSAWNGVSSSVTITSEGLLATRTSGTISAKFKEDGLQIWGNNSWTGSLSWYSSTSSNIDGVVLWSKAGKNLVLGYQGSNTNPSVFSTAMSIDGSSGAVLFNNPVTFKPSSSQGNIRIESDANFTKINYYYDNNMRSSLIFMSSGAIYADNIVNGTSKLLTA